MKSRQPNPQTNPLARGPSWKPPAPLHLKTQNLIENFNIGPRNQRPLRVVPRPRMDPFGYVRLRKHSRKNAKPKTQRSYVKLPKSFKKSKKIKLASGLEVLKRNSSHHSKIVDTSIMRNKMPVLSLFSAKENQGLQMNVLPPIHRRAVKKKGKEAAKEIPKKVVNCPLKRKLLQELGLDKKLCVSGQLAKARHSKQVDVSNFLKKKTLKVRGEKKERERE